MTDYFVDGLLPVHQDIEQVQVTVRIPEQFYTFTYGKEEWNQAVRDDTVPYLMDLDLSNMDILDEAYGPDGHQVSLW